MAIIPMLLASLPTAVHTPLKTVSTVLSSQQCLNLQTHVTEYYANKTSHKPGFLHYVPGYRDIIYICVYYGTSASLQGAILACFLKPS